MSFLSMLVLLDISNNQGSFWAACVLGVLTIVYVTMIRPMVKKKPDPLEKGPQFTLAQQRSVERQMSNLLVELSEMARQVTAQLDTRTKKLETLIEEADRKIAEMKGLSDRSAATPPAAAEPSGATNTSLAATSKPQADPRYTQIYALSDEGRAVADIAQQLDRPRGEIELILALRPK